MTSLSLQPFLDCISNIVTLTIDEQELLSSQISIRKCLKNQYLVQQGEVSKHEFFILKGATKTFYVDDAAQEHIVNLAIENWWTSDMGSFISQTPADFNVQCLEPTEVVQIEYEVIQELFISIPKLERFFRIILERALVASQKRIIRNLSMTAKDQYLFFKETYPQIDQRIPQYMIASYLGITKEFLSKIKNQLIYEQ